MDTCTKFEWKQRDGTHLGKGNRGYFGLSATMIGKTIWVIGGASGVSSFYTLNVSTREWDFVHLENVENFEFILHSACLFGDKIYIFGVKTRGSYEYRSDETWEFDSVLRELNKKQTFGDDDRPKYKEMHSADFCEELGIMALFGGEPFAVNQFRLLDLYTWVWSTPKTKGEMPPAKAKHSSSMVGTRLFVHSGGRHGNAIYDLYSVDLYPRKLLVWHKHEIQGPNRSGTRGSAMVYVGSGRLLIYGGYSYGRCVDDLLVVDNVLAGEPTCRQVNKESNAARSFVESNPDYLTFRGNAPSPRECSRMIYANDRIYLLGGNHPDGFSYFELLPQKQIIVI